MRYVYDCGFPVPKGFRALTLAEWIFVRGPTLSPALMRHEEAHVRQWRRWGYVLFPLAYLVGAGIGVVRGDAYRLNPFEIAARRAESEMGVSDG